MACEDCNKKTSSNGGVPTNRFGDITKRKSATSTPTAYDQKTTAQLWAYTQGDAELLTALAVDVEEPRTRELALNALAENGKREELIALLPDDVNVSSQTELKTVVKLILEGNEDSNTPAKEKAVLELVFSKGHLDSLTENKHVRDYAKTLGIEGLKSRKLETLKQELIDRLND